MKDAGGGRAEKPDPDGQRGEDDRTPVSHGNRQVCAHKKEKKHDAQTGVRYVGRQSVKKLVGQNQGVSNVELSGEDIKAFERVARKYGVDYAVKKVKGDAPRFLIFFKARDADALNAALSEYTDQKMRGKEHDRLREKLRAPIEQIITHKKQREQSR